MWAPSPAAAAGTALFDGWLDLMRLLESMTTAERSTASVTAAAREARLPCLARRTESRAARAPIASRSNPVTTRDN